MVVTGTGSNRRRRGRRCRRRRNQHVRRGGRHIYPRLRCRHLRFAGVLVVAIAAVVIFVRLGFVASVIVLVSFVLAVVVAITITVAIVVVILGAPFVCLNVVGEVGVRV